MVKRLIGIDATNHMMKYKIKEYRDNKADISLKTKNGKWINIKHSKKRMTNEEL